MALLRLLSTLDQTLVTPLVVLAEEGELATQLKQVGVEVHVMPLGEDLRATKKDHLGWRGTLKRGLQVPQLLTYARELARFAQQNRIDLVYTNSLKADFYGALVGRFARLPVIWHVRDRIEESYLPVAAVRMVRLLARRLPSCVVANSVSTLETLQLPPQMLTEVISSGMTQDYIRQCMAPRESNTIPQIGIVGRIASWKGQDIFLRAAALVLQSGRKAQFRLIGAPLFDEADYLVKLENLAKELRITDSVSFLGFQRDIPAQLRALDMLVHASTSPEPFGQVIVEGMVAGLPVIATNGGGAREIVTHNQTGLLVPLADVEALAEAMTTLLDDPALAARLAAAGRQHALESYTIEISARKSEALYAKVLARAQEKSAQPRTGGKQLGSFLLLAFLAELLVGSSLQIFH